MTKALRMLLAVSTGLLLSAIATARDLTNDPPPKPADPLATPEGRIAHSIKIPNPVPLGSGYRSGMSSKDYFDHLCLTEAGDFIFESAEDVDGILMLRARPKATDAMLMDRYALEDPFGNANWEATRPERIFVGPNGYRYFEKYVRDGSKRKVAHFSGYSARWEGKVMRKSPMQIEMRDSPLSKYGYTWRGVRREMDRELGIAGGELIVLELASNKVLAVRRGYIRTWNVKGSPTGIWWLSGEVCPESQKHLFANEQFLRKVLRPSSAKE